MKNVFNFSFCLCFIYSINSVFCDDFKCPEKGKVGELKVPNVLGLIDKQNGYRASIEIINPTRNNLIHDYYDVKSKVGYIDFEATIKDKMNRRYYYHSTEEKLAVREDTCTRLDLTQNEKIESVKDWFEPSDIVANSEIFKDLVHLGPTVLMIYAHSISDKASFIGSELIEGRTVNHWFYCSNPNGPYIDFYFDVKTSLPYRFSLYYPKWIETQEVISVNETRTVKKQIDSESKYVYNFYMFKPLVITSNDSIPYPLGYGCARKDNPSRTQLPDFSQIKLFTMDMEAIITYSDTDIIKTTARVTKRGDVISYEIKEENGTVRSIELPPPLGRFEVDEHTGRCKYLTSDYSSNVTLITRWPFHEDHGYNLLYYLVMKPPKDHAPTFVGDIPLGPYRVEEYKASKFFSDKVDAIVDYFYTQNTSDYVPSKVIFTKDRSDYYYDFPNTPIQVEVTIMNHEEGSHEYEDRFDVSGCYEEPGSHTWFQILFSNPSMSGFNMQLAMQSFKKGMEIYLSQFIPITRIGEIHAQEVDSKLYLTVKLHDRIHYIDAYRRMNQCTIISPSSIVKTSKVEDCEAICSATEKCFSFTYCSNYDCLVDKHTHFGSTAFEAKDDCSSYSRAQYEFDLIPLVNENYLSTMSQVLQQIRDRISSGELSGGGRGLSAIDLFIVSGPEEIGNISQELHTIHT